ncbi:hypothetical protein [Undibacterium terreum]|uniref:Uncharacterized protein n=1 Tax=Undibacterium terreum TaxID=1224302 RepID=A0A916V129_9BURK|nr:hypothetical protein [Undibacterium terreum]GGD00138.1 hypothetical protein GCM10011396_54570 [Undibacterium terreum]
MIETQKHDALKRLELTENTKSVLGVGFDYTDAFTALGLTLLDAEIDVQGGTFITKRITGYLVEVWAKAVAEDVDMLIECTPKAPPAIIGGVTFTPQMVRTIVVHNRPR